MTSPRTTPATGSVRANVGIGVVSIVVGAGVIPYGASMPYIREGIPGPGLFPMMIGGFLILFGVLLILTNALTARRERAHAARLAEAGPSETAATVASAPADVPADTDDAPASGAVMDTDIGSDGARRWINGAVLMGSIVFFVLAAEPLGFPITMAIVVFAIVFSLRAKWWVAAATAVLTTLALWAMFEQGLMVQLPDGIIDGF